MRKIVYDENCNVVDELAERNEEIKANLDERITQLRTEQNADSKGKRKYGFRAMMQIEDELMKSTLMSAEKFASLDCDDIEYYWQSFHALIAHYNMLFEIVPTRQTFMLYMSINSRMYKKLLRGGDNEDEDIKDFMEFIEDRLVGKAFTAGESGNADVKAVSSRLSAKDVGHSVISASEDKLIDEVAKRSPTDMLRQLDLITGGSGKLLK
jgi:predicted phage gp36 major capsid-like protein